MAAINGNIFLLFINISGNAKYIAGVTSNSIEISADMLDVSTKDSGGWATFMAGRKSGTMQVDFIYNTDGADATHYDIDDLWRAFTDGTQCTLTLGQYSTGQKYFNADSFINSMSISADQNSVTTVSMSFQLTGAITVKTVGEL